MHAVVLLEELKLGISKQKWRSTELVTHILIFGTVGGRRDKATAWLR